MNANRQPPRLLRALLLDLDGTACDTHGLINRCFDHAIQTHLGQPARYEIWQANVGLPLENVVRATYTHYEQPLRDADLPDIYETYRAHMRASCDDIRAFPGVREMLEQFQAAGTRLAIVTTKGRSMADRHLETSGLTEFFERLVTWEDTEAHKPDAGPFRFALDALGVSSEEAVHVGDSPADITGAKAAGLYAIAACWGTDNRPALLSANPDAIAENPTFLFSILQP